MKTKISYKSKIIMLYVLVIVVPCFLAVIYLNLSLYSSFSDKAAEDVMVTLQQMNHNVDFKMEAYERVLSILSVDKKIQSTLSQKEKLTIKQDIEDEREIAGILDNTLYNHDLMAVRLYVSSQKMYANQNAYFFNMDKIEDEEWYHPATRNAGKVYWYADEEKISGVEVIKGVCMIRDIYGDFSRIGYAEICIRRNDFFDFAKGLPNWSKNTVVVAEDNEIIVSSDKSLIGTSAKQLEGITISDDFGEIWNDSHSGLVSYVRVANTPWKIVASINRFDMLEFAKLTFIAIVINAVLVVSIILLAFLMMYFVINYTINRLHNISRLVDVEGLSYVDRIDADNAGDFEALEYKVNALTKELKDKIEQSYIMKINERNALLKALQEQINPHFLYNTLDTINWMARDAGTVQISEMLDLLAKYFRISLSKGRSIIRLEEEIELTNVYFKIQKSRFMDRFIVKYDVDKSLNECAFPKLTLQPIVENALIHGLNREDKSMLLNINISVKKSGEDIAIEVSDNGIGIDDETLKKIHEGATGSDECLQGGYGIYNVYQRIKLFCDNESKYGVFIESKPGEGTKVSLIIKNKRYEE